MIYALFDDDNKMVSASNSRDFVTRALRPSMKIEMWNALFEARSAKTREQIFKQYGWSVRRGAFAERAKP